ncbi:hypothetical protein [Lactiplantibacillus daowaiensis]|uniref:Prophage protein n=1 Tax=Lactiplantibacillus daowaiensis TaxID=2559918 RepID=A0ABW1RX10_9LACO|nr:hypothetical protein [Lactiplantibacillus daowaiensis]
MKLEDIAHNVAHAIKDRSSDNPYILAIEFTDKKSKGKSATGCVIVQMPTAKTYSLTSYDYRYMDAGKDILAMELGAFFECDDDLDQRQPMIDLINELVSQDTDNHKTLVTD